MEAIVMKPLNKHVAILAPSYTIAMMRESDPDRFKDVEMLPENQKEALINEMVFDVVTSGSKLEAFAADCENAKIFANVDKVWIRPELLMKANPLDADQKYIYVHEHMILAYTEK